MKTMKNKKFPLIAEHIGQSSGAFTVCFVNETEGIVVKSKNKMCEIGYYAKEWASCFNKYEWCIIAQPSEYPKEMYVYNNENPKYKVITKVLGYFENLGYLNADGDFWKYAEYIPEEEKQKLFTDEERQILMDKLSQVQELNQTISTILNLKL